MKDRGEARAYYFIPSCDDRVPKYSMIQLGEFVYEYSI